MAEHGIKLSELIEKYGGVQTWKSGVTRPLKYVNTAESSEQEPEQSGGIGDMLLDGLKYSTGAFGSLFPDGFLGYAGGTLAEMLGNGLQAMGDPDRTLAARYNPALASVLRSIGGTAQDIADSALEYGASQVKPRNNDEYLGSLRNQLDSGFYGVMQGDASMVKADKSVSAMDEAIRRLADENAIAPSLSWEYILSPHGLTRSFGNMAGSMGAILPSMALAPESAFLTPANAITRFLINRGAYNLAKRTAGNMPNYLRYAATSAPAEALSEGGHVRTENLAQGVSDEEATRRGWNTAAANLPILLGSNLIEAGLFGTPFRQGSALSKLAQAGLRTGGNALQQGTEEALQKAVSNAQTGKEYGLTPFGWTPDQWQDFAEGFAGTLPMGIVGSGAHAISDFRRPAETDEERADREAYEQGSDENISVGDFSTRAEKQSRNLQSSHGIDSFMRAISGQESGGNYDAVNPDSGASGAFQIMPDNWSAWAQDAGLSPDAPMTPENQELVARNKMLEYYNKFGNWRDVAIAWYAGEGEVTNPSYDHDAPQGEYPSVNSYADSVMSRFRKVGGEETEGVTYLGNNGKGEGRYWVRQGDYVSFDGAQPDLLNAVDILGKMFYDRTGKQLVITAGTNGNHAGGEHSHGAGWKVDIADAGANGVGLDEDGALFTADYKAQPFLKEFIEFGRSLGLGMNLEDEGTPNVHIDVALDGHQWDGNGEDAGGFSLDELRRRGRGIAPSQQDTSSPPPQEETPKPLFDLNAEDEQTQKLLERFASERVQSLANAENPDGNELRFFTGLFNEAGEFQNTEANRAALRERYGKEITSWANEILKQESPAQPAAPARTQSSTSQQGAPKVTNEDILATVDNFLEKLRTDRPNDKTLLELEEARRAGDVAKMESILRQNNVEITPVESTAPVAPSPQPPVQSENVVQNNQPPENILTSEQETAQPQQETKPSKPKNDKAQSHIKRVLNATNLANKSPAQLKNIVQSIQWLAAQNGIIIPPEDLVKLNKHNPKAITNWRDKLTSAGALEVAETPQTKPQTSPQQETPSAPQQTTQPPVAETTATPKETPLQAALRRAREILDTQEYTPNTHPLLETQQRQDTEQDVFDLIPTTEDDTTTDESESPTRESGAVEEPVVNPTLEDKRLAERRQWADAQREIQQKEAEQKAQEEEQARREALSPDIANALAPASQNKTARQRQGEGILNLINSTPFRNMYGVISLPRGLDISLRNGDREGIKTAQTILQRRGVRPVSSSPTTEVTAQTRGTVTPSPQEQAPVITQEAPERQSQIDADSELAVAPISADKRARQEQGKAIKRLINSPQFVAQYGRINLPRGLDQSLENGDRRGIEVAQRLIQDRTRVSSQELAEREETAQSEREAIERETQAEREKEQYESDRRAIKQRHSVLKHQKKSARILQEEADADEQQFVDEMIDSMYDEVEEREELFNGLMDKADEQERQQNAKNAELEQRAQKARKKALAPVSESKSRRKEQGRAIEHFLKAPSLKVASDKINATPGLMRGIREGSKQALNNALQIINDEINAQNERREIERREREAAEARRNEPSEQEKQDAERRADRRRRDVRDEQADEYALSAQEEDIDRRYQKSQRASENAQQEQMRSTAESVQRQREDDQARREWESEDLDDLFYLEEEIADLDRTESEPREEPREEKQENVTRREQPAQEDDRDVFDLLPESNELNDVEENIDAEREYNHTFTTKIGKDGKTRYYMDGKQVSRTEAVEKCADMRDKPFTIEYQEAFWQGDEIVTRQNEKTVGILNLKIAHHPEGYSVYFYNGYATLATGLSTKADVQAFIDKIETAYFAGKRGVKVARDGTVSELNDVESSERTEQRPTRENPQPSPQQETPPSTNKPAPTRKTPAEQREERAKNRTPKQQQMEDEPESNVIKGEYGNEAEIESVTGVEHQVKYKVVEASDLVTSHERDEGGYTVHENPNFPQELQPRDRETVSMTDALRRMIGHLIPKRFFQQALSANIGAPVVRKDGVILNGNGRTIAAIESYKEGKADNYKEALIDNAQKFGINPSKVAKMKQPILVREIVSDDLTLEQQQDIARDAEGGAKMGAREQAKADAKRISEKTLTGFNPNDIDLSASKLNGATLELLTDVLRDILTGNEINAYTDAKGNISTDGITRAKNALFAYAYGSDELLTRSSEASNDDNIRNVTAALMNAAPQVAIIRAGMKSGLLHNYNFNTIVEAVGKLSDLRKEGKAVKDFLRETQLAGMEFSNEAREILSFVARNGRSAKRITEFFQNIAQGIQSQGDPKQGSLFGANEPIPFMDLIKTAIKKIEGGMDDLFGAPQEQSNKTPKETKSAPKEVPKQDTQPKPQQKPQPDTQKTVPAREEPNPQEQEAKQEPVTEKKKGTQSEREPIADEIIYSVHTATGRTGYRRIDYYSNNEVISKSDAEKHIRHGWAVQLKDVTDEIIHHIALQRILQKWLDKQSRRDEYVDVGYSLDALLKKHPLGRQVQSIREQYGNKELTAQEAYKKMAELLGVKKQADHILPDNVKKFLESNKGKADITGAPNIDTSNVVAEKDLTPAQKLLVSFGKKLGVEVVFFNNPDGRFRGVHKGGKTFLNINGNKELGGVFWHESFHWLKNNNPELYKALVKAAGITDAQRKAYLETSKRKDLKSNDEIDEEILADMMDDVAKRTGLFQSIAGKNRGLIERAIQWFKDTLNKFIDHFRNPQGKLTTAQAQALASEFGRIANQLKDPNGNQIFRYNRRTHNVELADNRERTEAELAEMTAKNARFEAKYSVDSNDNSTKSFKQRVKNLLGVEGKNIPIHKQMKRQLEDLSDMKIAADHLPEGVQVKIDEIAGVIRTGREYDWANILPEVGNAVAEQLGITQSAEMGNYIGKFILNGAPNDTSAEAKEFAKAMRENTEMRNKVMAIRSTFDTWNNMSDEEQMIASTRYDKEIPPLKERAQKFWQYLRTELFDTQMPIHYHVAKFVKATGIKLSESINPEIAFRNLRGMQQRAMRMVFGNELTIEALQKMYPNVDFSDVKPMAVILESIKAEPGSQRYILFDQFVKACHFLDIHQHNYKVLGQQNKVRDEIRKLRNELAKADTKKKKAELERSIKKKEESLEALKQKIMDTPDAYTYDKCADLVSKYSDEFGKAQKDLVRYSRALLDIWVDSGMMDRRRYHQLLAAYPNYVPLHREFDENPNLNTADSMKHMLGSTKDIGDSIAAISNNTFDYIQRTEKNKAKLLLANLANFDGVGGIFELVDGSSPNDGTIIHFYENGKRKALQCSDEDIVKAVNSMNQPTMNLFLKVLQVPALLLRTMATARSPGFILGNFLRDPQDAWMVSKSYHAGTKMELLKDFAKSLNPFVTWSYLLHAIQAGDLLDSKHFKKYNGKMLEEYRVSGAAQSDFFSFDRDYKAEAIERLTKKNLTRYASPKGVFEFLRKAGEITELATRLYVYDRVKTDRAKKHGGINIYDDLVTAAFESRDFIDFARHGNAGRTWNTLTAFANPVLQGFDKQWRTYDLGQLKKFGGTEETQKNFYNSVARLFLKGILPALVLSLLHKDEDWYKDDVQDWEKENYWIISEGLRVPKGADLGLRFFSNLTEHLIASDPVRADKVLQPLKGILPDLMPTAFLPIFECMANYDLFRRQPIVPQREINKFKNTPELQYDSTNSKLAVLLGRVTGVSPRYIDHVIYGYTSGFGKEATHLIDTVTPGRHAAWTRSDVPFFSRVLRTPYRAPKIVSEYYEEFGRQESYAQRLAWEKKHGNPNAKPSKEYDPALHRRLKNIQRAMQNLNAAERAIMDDPKLTSEQVEEKREEIQKRRVELCRKAFQRAR